MVFDQLDQNPGLRFLFTLAIGVVLIQGLRFGAPIVLPVALAGFLAVICLPIVLWLQHRGIPLVLAIPLTVLALACVFGLLIMVGTQQIPELQKLLLAQGEAIEPVLDEWLLEVEDRFGLPEEGGIRATVLGFTDISTLASLATGATTWALSVVSSTFLVFLLLAFALGEAAVFPRQPGRDRG